MSDFHFQPLERPPADALVDNKQRGMMKIVNTKQREMMKIADTKQRGMMR